MNGTLEASTAVVYSCCMSLLIAVVLLVLCFYLLAVLTEEFFVPAIDKLAKRLHLSSDASGATFLAMGSSAPEFFTSFFAVVGIGGAGHADIGAGTIVGSAIFNILVIVGATAMFKAVKLQWKPVIRDQVFYILTILLLLAVFWDGRIVLYEAMGFVMTYCLYVFVVINWRKWFHYEEVEIPDETPGPARNRLHAATHKLLGLVIPDPKKYPKRYPISFACSVLAIAGLSWILVREVTVVADVMHINPTFLALTVLAAGTSIPDLIGSVVVAKQGRGDMAVSNAVGSNIFDILFGLGLPWIIALIIRPGSIVVGTENLSASILLLFATVVAILFLLIIRNWRIGHRSGLLLIALYAAYCIYIAATVA